MTTKQLAQIRRFAKGFYQKTDPFHDWHHPVLTVKYARMLAKQYKHVDRNVLDAACYLHDIGRINKDDGHPEESARIAKPFLEKIKLNPAEADAILHTVSVHAKERIHEARNIEAKLLFDADKLQILSVYGFLRVCFFLVYKRRWKMEKVVNFMWDFVKSVYENHLQTPQAKKILTPQIKLIEEVVIQFHNGLEGKIKEK